MEEGGLPAQETARGRDYGGGVTFSVVVTCLMAASCGLIFGYDIGVSGACALITASSHHFSMFFDDGHILNTNLV